MNDHSGSFPSSGGALPRVPQSVPAHTGLREMVSATAPATVAQSGQRFSLADVWRIVAKWWWLIAAIVVGCLLAAVVASLLVQPLYRSKVSLEINQESMKSVQVGALPSMQIPVSYTHLTLPTIYSV